MTRGVLWLWWQRCHGEPPSATTGEYNGAVERDQLTVLGRFWSGIVMGFAHGILQLLCTASSGIVALCCGFLSSARISVSASVVARPDSTWTHYDALFGGR